MALGNTKINVHAPGLWQDPAMVLRGPSAQPGCGDFCFVWSGTVAEVEQLLASVGADDRGGTGRAPWRSRRRAGPRDERLHARPGRQPARVHHVSLTPMPPRTPAEHEEWLSLTSEEAIDPTLPIVDPHHHLWTHMQPPYLLDELLADTGSGHNVTDTVFVECGWALGPRRRRPGHGPGGRRRPPSPSWPGAATAQAGPASPPSSATPTSATVPTPAAPWTRCTTPATAGSSASATPPPGTPTRRSPTTAPIRRAG